MSTTATGQKISQSQIDLVEKVCAIISANLDTEPTLADLSAQVHVSQYHLQRVFKRVMGITPRQYAEALRLDCVKDKLRAQASVTDAMVDVGYSSSSRLYEKVHDNIGMTPARYRAGGEGMNMAYWISDSPMGRMLVGATERGVSSICLGDDDDALLDMLQAEYPNAHIYEDEETLSTWVDMLVAHLNGWKPCLDLPIDVQATAFQRRVWTELQRIPYGETRTYKQIAEAIGNPKAVRAVARACATNPVALVTPCHRVVRNDGTMGGYRWGVERKEALLHHEHQRETKPGEAST